MSGYFQSGKIKSLQSHFTFDVAVLLYVDEGYFYAVAPALDIVGAGKTERQATQSFETVLDEFIKYSFNKRTLLQELKKLGWEVPDNYAKKFKAKWPELDELKKDPAWAPIWTKNPKVRGHKVVLPF
jgi:hypothetical protein